MSRHRMWRVGDLMHAVQQVDAANRARTARRLRESVTSPAEVEFLAFLHFFDLADGVELQYPVGPYDLDFYWPDGQLCVEIDGSQHQYQVEHDQKRDEVIAKRGILTLRLPAKIADAYPTECVELVECVLRDLRAGDRERPARKGEAIVRHLEVHYREDKANRYGTAA